MISTYFVLTPRTRRSQSNIRLLVTTTSTTAAAAVSQFHRAPKRRDVDGGRSICCKCQMHATVKFFTAAIEAATPVSLALCIDAVNHTSTTEGRVKSYRFSLTRTNINIEIWTLLSGKTMAASNRISTKKTSLFHTRFECQYRNVHIYNYKQSLPQASWRDFLIRPYRMTWPFSAVSRNAFNRLLLSVPTFHCTTVAVN